MTLQTADTTVRASTEVDAPVEHCFRVYTEEIGSWWDKDHHIIEAPYDHMVFEPRAGGAIYDVGTDGSECRWGTVLAYEPPSRVVFSWNISPQWQLETDPARCSEVEVRFSPLDGDRTLVELEHRHIDRHGDGWAGMRAAVADPNGWRGGLRAFAAQAGGAAGA